MSSPSRLPFSRHSCLLFCLPHHCHLPSPFIKNWKGISFPNVCLPSCHQYPSMERREKETRILPNVLENYYKEEEKKEGIIWRERMERDMITITKCSPRTDYPPGLGKTHQLVRYPPTKVNNKVEGKIYVNGMEGRIITWIFLGEEMEEGGIKEIINVQLGQMVK